MSKQAPLVWTLKRTRLRVLFTFLLCFVLFLVRQGYNNYFFSSRLFQKFTNFFRGGAGG